EQLSEARDRLARVDKDEPDTEASTSERDAASTALDAAKTMEMEAQMSLRSAQDKVGHAAGRGDSLRRLAPHEREATARHDRTMERRRALGELARTVAAHAKPLGERASAAMSRAAQSRDELATKRTVLNNQLNAAKQTVNGARQR